MPGFVVLAAAALAASAQPPATAPNTALQPGSSAAISARHEICYTLAFDGAYPPLNVVDCLRLEKAPAAVFKAQVCGYLREREQLRDYRFASYGDCVASGLVQ